jgi:hypothetical protein
MKRKTVLALLGLGLAFAMGFGVAAYMTSSGGNIIPRDVVAGGGGRSADSSGHVLNSTIGQPATAIMTASNGSMLTGGFQTMARRATTEARRWQLY